MTSWEYGFLHAIGVVTPSNKTSTRLPRTIYIAADAHGARYLEDCTNVVSAMNQLGAEGWYIESPGITNLNLPQPVLTLIDKLEGVSSDGSGRTRYFMRRETTSS